LLQFLIEKSSAAAKGDKDKVTAKLEVAKKALDAVVKARLCFAPRACCASPLRHSITAHGRISACAHLLLCFQYCDQALCRRHALLTYFGEPKPASRSAVPSGSRCCDYCAAPARAKEQAALLKSLAQGGGPRSSLAFASTETFIRRVKKPEYEDFSGMCEDLSGASAAVAKPRAREEWRVVVMVVQGFMCGSSGHRWQV
jgi:hypothetical protein